MRILPILSIAALVAILFFGYLIWAHRWNEPPFGEDKKYEAELEGAGIHVPATVKCVGCPSILVVGRPRTLHYEVFLKINSFELEDKKLGLWYEPGGNGTLEPVSGIWLSRNTRSGEATGEATLKATATDENFPGVIFHFTAWDVAADGKEIGTPAAIGTVYAPLPAHAPAFQVIAPYLYAFLVFVFFVGAIYLVQHRIEEIRRKSDKKIADVEESAKQNPGKVKFAWDVARVKLEAYFDRNLIQVNLVFWVAVFVMIVGFTFVLAGIVLSYGQPKVWTTSMVAVVSGIITQFIGATFMVIYKSTMAQANEYMGILERINSVGMSVQMLDSLPDQSELQNSTRAAIAKLLLGGKLDSPVKAKAQNA